MNNDPEQLNRLPKRALKIIRTLAQGNGAESDSIQIKNAKGDVLCCEALTHLELHHNIDASTKKGRHEIGKVLQNPDDIQKAIDDTTRKAMQNDEMRRHISNILLNRPDKGFSLHAQYFDVPKIGGEYSYIEPCQTCRGQGRATCSQCGGRRVEACQQCRGQAVISCQFCRGSGYMQGPNGQQTTCNKCHGRKQTGCPLCQQTGQTSCRQCRGNGQSKCQQCDGSAFTTHVARLIFKVKTLFEIDRATLPPPVVKIFEDAGDKMVAGHHIKLHAEQVRRNDGGLAIQYNAEFPYGDIEFTINGKPLRTHLFGYKGKMLKMPNFLEDLTHNAKTQLQQAGARGQNAAKLIAQASRKRLIAQALTLSATRPPKHAVIALKKQYPMGISNGEIKNMIILSRRAITNLTRKNRWGGLALAGLLMASINMLYFLPSIRGSITSILPAEKFILSCDLMLIPLGVVLAQFITIKASAYPIKKALNPLLSKQQRTKFTPKGTAPLWQSIALSLIVFIACLWAAKTLGLSVIRWLPF